MTAPDYAVGVDESIHSFPAQPGGGQAADLFTQITASVRFFLDSFIGQVAKAFGGIEIFGWKPLQFLADWGQQRIDDAAANYAAAIGAQATADNAQSTADSANVSINELAGRLGAGEVTNGVTVFDTFDRTGALGAKYNLTYFGGGAGSLDCDGNNAHWTAVGAAFRGVDVLRLTPLYTRFQGVRFVQGQGIVSESTPAWLQLYGRSNLAKNARILAYITLTTAEIGIVVGGTYTRLGAAVTIDNNAGDGWYLQIGTANDDREFVLWKGTTEVVRRTDAGGTSLMGAGYEYTGWVENSGQAFTFFGFLQTSPPDIQSFNAYDRLKTSA